MTTIGYLVPNVGLHDEEELDRRERIADELTPSETEVAMIESEWGPRVIESTIEEEWATVGLLRSVAKVEDKFDAFVVGCFGDPGLVALRELTRTSVVGPAEVSFHTVTQVADRFACLNLRDSTEPVIRHVARNYGLEDRMDVLTLDVGVADIDDGSEELVANMLSAGRQAAANGAQALVPGCMGLAFLRVHEEITDEIGIPFLDPAALSLETAGLWARHEITQSPKAFPSSDRERFSGLFDDHPKSTTE